MITRRNSRYSVSGINSYDEKVGGLNLYDNDSFIKNNVIRSMTWSYENEEILVEWGDIAQCYKWLHTESYMNYSHTHAWFTIPIIILSTSVGAISFLKTGSSDSLHPHQPRPSLFVTGGINIFVGILATIQEYLKVSQLQESHRVSSINWDKFTRNIRIELAKSPDERMDAHHFIKLSRINFDCMMETSPPICSHIKTRFMKTFRGKKGSNQRTVFDNIKKPDICSSIVSINDTRRQWFDKNSLISEVSKSRQRRSSLRNANINYRNNPLNATTLPRYYRRNSINNTKLFKDSSNSNIRPLIRTL